jgi:membrane protease YdiL (CAAX protease family)
VTAPVVPVNAFPSVAILVRRDQTPWLRPELVAPWWEIMLVLTVMLGPFIYSSTRYAVTPHASNYISLMLTNHKFLGLIADESLLLAVMFGYLRWRGWKPADFRIRAGWKGTVVASPIAFCAYMANTVTVALLLVVIIAFSPHPHGWQESLRAQSPRILPHSIDVSWFFIYTGSIVNAFLEELVFMGYGFNQFAARRGPLFALMVMVLLRMLLHTYQGPVHMLGIAAFSIVFGLFYWYLRKLWPLILAHALIDIATFSLVKIIFGR